MLIRSRFGRLLMWMGLAAATTYFFDPERGEVRRQRLRQRFDKLRNTGEKAKLDAGL